MSFSSKSTTSSNGSTEIKKNQLTNGELHLDYLAIKKASLIFRALNHQLRQDILKYIDTKGKVTVTEIFIELRLEQSVASQHLAILRRAGILRTEREGKFMYYKLNEDKLKLIINMVVNLLN